MLHVLKLSVMPVAKESVMKAIIEHAKAHLEETKGFLPDADELQESDFWVDVEPSSYAPVGEGVSRVIQWNSILNLFCVEYEGQGYQFKFPSEVMLSEG